MEYERLDAPALDVAQRITNYNEFHTPLPEKEQKLQGERCMNCGVPFCQSGMKINGMISGCPLNNLIPEWNHLVSMGAWKQAYQRLTLTNPFPSLPRAFAPRFAKRRAPAARTATR